MRRLDIHINVCSHVAEFFINYHCKRSLGQGNVFTGMCHSFCPEGGGVPACNGQWGGCVS